MSDVKFVDTTLRDGNQSLWAFNMKTAAMLEAIERMDQAGFESMEFFSATMIKKYVREHKENPWHWLREGARRARNTPLRLHGGVKGGLEKKPTAVARLVVRHVVDTGIRLTRTSNPLERLFRVQGGRGRTGQAGRGRRREPDLLGVAETHRRILRAEGP